MQTQHQQPHIELWQGSDQRFGHCGTPSLAVNVVGRVSSPAGVHSAGYQLNDGPLVPLTLGPSAFRLLNAGDFNIEFGRDKLTPGENTLAIRAWDKAGRDSRLRAMLHYTVDVDCPLPYELHWSDCETIQDAAQIVDGNWQLTHSGVRPVEIGYDRLIAVGDVGWRDYEITAAVTIHKISDKPEAYIWPSCGPIVGLVARWQRHGDWGDIKPDRGYLPLGAIGLCRQYEDKTHSWQLFSGADGSTLAEAAAECFELDCELIFKLAVSSQGGSPSRYSLKVWPASDAEPAEWSISASNHASELDSGAVLLLAHHVDATFGDVRVEPLPLCQ